MSNLNVFLDVLSIPPGTPETNSSLVWMLNGTLFVAMSAMVVWLWHFAQRRDLASANLRLKRFLVSTPILFVLALGAVFNVGTAAYFGYEVPRDILQDIVSAKLLLQGQPAFPLNMTDQIRDVLDHEPAPASLARWSPELAQIEKRSYEAAVTEPWAQAHPAGMTLLFALFVPWMHVRTIQLLFSLVAIASLLGTVWLLQKGLGSPASPRFLAALTLGLLGWFPFWMVLRNGQLGCVLTFLMVLAWYLLRSERNVTAGLCLGLATALKLFPGLLIVYLLIRRRRAFWPAAIAAAFFLVASFGLVGWQNTMDYTRVSHMVQEHYKDYPANLSLTSVFLALTPGLELKLHISMILSAACLCLLAWTVSRKSSDAAGVLTFDLEYAMFMVLLPVLSPVSWDHYLVVLALPVAVLIFALREGGLFAERWMWTAGFLVVSALLAVPRHFSNWVGLSVLHLRHPIFLIKLPVIAVFGTFALLWGMRLHLAQRTDLLDSPEESEQIEAGDRPLAA